MHQGMGRDRALSICGITKDQFYHRPKEGRRGARPSPTTQRQTGDGIIEVPNREVVDRIRAHLSDELNTEGYRRMTGQLQLMGYYINHKKVYRLMKRHCLLRAKPVREAKNYVRYRIVAPEGPLRLMEVDIKYVWVAGKGRHAYILTIIDVFTRYVLHWRVGWQMKQGQVEEAWSEVIEQHLQANGVLGWQVDIEVRSDNGSQFSAKKLRSFLEKNHLLQTFTHPYTPQENGHIESFHSILGDWLEKKWFGDMVELEHALSDFYVHYNEKRVHGSILNLPPKLFWEQWDKGNVEREVVDEEKRKVRLRLKVPRQTLLSDV